jgi:phage shock protein A
MKNIFGRLYYTIRGQVETNLRAIEDHNAIAVATLQSMERALARVQVQRERVRRDGESLQSSIDNLQNLVATWEDRAKRSASSDKDKALQCLQQRERSQLQLETFLKQKSQHSNVEQELDKKIDLLRTQILCFRQKVNELATRQTSAKAIQNCELGVLSDLDSTLARWELAVAENEAGSVSIQQENQLDLEFKREEERSRLELELGTLMQKSE